MPKIPVLERMTQNYILGYIKIPGLPNHSCRGIEVNDMYLISNATHSPKITIHDERYPAKSLKHEYGSKIKFSSPVTLVSKNDAKFKVIKDVNSFFKHINLNEDYKIDELRVKIIYKEYLNFYKQLDSLSNEIIMLRHDEVKEHTIPKNFNGTIGGADEDRETFNIELGNINKFIDNEEMREFLVGLSIKYDGKSILDEVSYSLERLNQNENDLYFIDLLKQELGYEDEGFVKICSPTK